MAKMVIVVAFDISEDEREGFEQSQKMLQTIKPMFEHEEGVEVYGAIRETADTIIDVLTLGG